MNTTRRIIGIVVIPIVLVTIGFMAGRSSVPDAPTYLDGFADGYQQALSETLTETSDLEQELVGRFAVNTGMVRGSVLTYQDDGQTICIALEDPVMTACGPMALFDVFSDVGVPVGSEVLIQQGHNRYRLSVWGESE